MIAAEKVVFQPQPGPQSRFLASMADITGFGGAAGGGKSFGVLLYIAEPLAVHPVNGFQAVVFRREYPRITQSGGIWDTSKEIFPVLGAKATEGNLEYHYRRKGVETSVHFHHLQHESTCENWKGAQVPLFAFEELTEFTERQFFYIQSRNRSMCGYKPRTLATFNADADSWVKKFFAPWVSEEWPVTDRCISGERRYFIREGNTIVWLPKGKKTKDATSVTFIASNIYDNPILMEKDPNYIKRLKSLPLVDRLRLLNGDWTIRPEGGTLFRREWFKIIDAAPAQDQWSSVARAWDFAATEEKDNSKKAGPDWTASVKVARLKDGRFCVLDARKMREKPMICELALKNLAEADGPQCMIALEQEPGAAAVAVMQYYTRLLAGYVVKVNKTSRSKIERARPVSAQCEAGNVLIVRGPQTDDFLADLESFPNPRVHDDFPDAFDLCMAQFFGPQTDDHLQDLRNRLALRDKQREEMRNATAF